MDEARRPSAPRRARRSALPWLGLAAALAGCRYTERASHNLDVVLSSEDNFRYVGDLQGLLEYLVTGFVDPSLLQEGGLLAPDENAPIKDPTDVAIENLIELARGTDGRPRWREVEQVRHFVRYAVGAPSALVRERAMLELAPHAKRLAITEPWSEPVAPANAAEVRVRLEGLIDAAKSLLASRESAPDTARLDFRAACEVLAAAEVDIRGGRRILRAISPFLRATNLGRDSDAAMLALSESLQRRLVAEALARGLRDPAPIVRAAAIRANYAAFGDPFLVAAVFRSTTPQMLSMMPPWIRAVVAREGELDMPPDDPSTYEARVALFELLAARGLPPSAARADSEGLETRFTLLLCTVQVATRHEVFHPRARTAAMLALASLTGSELATLREEEWIEWWRAHGAELQTRIQERIESEARAATPDAADSAADRPLKTP